MLRQMLGADNTLHLSFDGTHEEEFQNPRFHSVHTTKSEHHWLNHVSDCWIHIVLVNFTDPDKTTHKSALLVGVIKHSRRKTELYSNSPSRKYYYKIII
jgi:hypothetical protein